MTRRERMYAVIKIGGKQERVAPGDVLEVEYMKVDPGSSVEFDPILVVDDDGKPHVGKALSRAKVVAKLLGDRKGDKVRVFKYRPKSGYRRNQGHRQLMTLLEVQEVGLSAQRKAVKEDGEKAAPRKKAAAKKTSARKRAAKKTTTKKATAKKTTTRKSTSRKSTTRKS
ncbi:MAG TPA: 50S ribosomal protein L21 [Actinomycetota bacterium]|nr:50S ribosomal protein L21 [Actinomycetota bacterium]